MGLFKLLRIASVAYTHTLIDLPSTLDQEFIKMATEVSDAVLVVMTLELPAVWRVQRLLSFLACSKI